MRHVFRLLPIFAWSTFLLVFLPVQSLSLETDFDLWLKDLRSEAAARGFSQKILELAIADIKEPLSRVLELDQSQPELTQSLQEYVTNRINRRLISDGRKMMRRYPTWLGRVEQGYEVQRRFITALWGIETHYGKHTGNFPTIHALVTLAHDGRRGVFFRHELFEALHILNDGHISLKRMQGSWAGAMGQCQFMPSSFRRHSVDEDGDGHIDIWNSVPDVFASIANYLKKAGWQDDQTWGRQVKLPGTLDHSLAGLEKRLSLLQWQELGIRRMNGKDLPRRALDASLLLPDGPEGPAYLVYDNFRVLLSWNKSNSFAIAVGILSDRLALTENEKSGNSTLLNLF